MPANPPSFWKGLALAVATLTVSTWALGTLWLHAQPPPQGETARIAAR